MSMMFDLNTTDNEEEGSVSPSSSMASASSDFSPTTSSSAVSMELWHACAGPLISLPKKGTAVVYFPQAHVEHLPEHPAVVYDLPPHVFCHVLDVKLQADSASDEVYAQVSLVPDQQMGQKWKECITLTDDEDEEAEGSRMSITPHMFCKTLTASDTSTHGGFSVPRRAAEDCFPPLDYKQQRPSQEIVAKDLHGTEWKFRHIYRGQPRRHLLTTGWSAFVNKKKLASGDAVLFLRGGDGVLRLGVRRADQVKTEAKILPPIGSQLFNATSIACLVNAISMGRAFNICYNPRARSSKIIVPYLKFSKSLAHSFSSGMRFKMRSETEDSSERRRSGIIIGVSDADPVRWPGSKWKCLLVRWDDSEVNCLNRVSPWEIEQSGPASGHHGFVLPSTKRTRVSFPTTKPDFQFAKDGNGVSDFGESLRFQKVLQGQEVSCISTPYRSRHYYPDPENFLEGTVLHEPSQYHKVLQGQEILSSFPSYRNVLNGVQVPSHRNPWFVGSSPSRSPFMSPLPSVDKEVFSHPSIIPTQQFLQKDQNFASTRLFGFPLTEEGQVAKNSNVENPDYNFMPCSEDKLCQPLMKHGVRDMLLDIAL